MANLHRAFRNQEQSTKAQYQITSAKGMFAMKGKEFDQPLRKKIIDSKERVFEFHDPRNAQKKSDAYEHGQEQTKVAGALPLLFGQFIRYNGDKDDVINAKYDF